MVVRYVISGAAPPRAAPAPAGDHPDRLPLGARRLPGHPGPPGPARRPAGLGGGGELSAPRHRPGRRGAALPRRPPRRRGHRARTRNDPRRRTGARLRRPRRRALGTRPRAARGGRARARRWIRARAPRRRLPDRPGLAQPDRRRGRGAPRRRGRGHRGRPVLGGALVALAPSGAGGPRHPPGAARGAGRSRVRRRHARSSWCSRRASARGRAWPRWTGRSTSAGSVSLAACGWACPTTRASTRRAWPRPASNERRAVRALRAGDRARRARRRRAPAPCASPS